MKNKSWGLISAHRNAVYSLWTLHTAVEENDSNIDTTVAGTFKQPEAGKLHVRVFGTWWRSCSLSKREQSAKEGRRWELIRVELHTLQSFPLSSPLQRWNKKQGRANLCIPLSNGRLYSNSEAANTGMGRCKQKSKVEGNEWGKCG